MYALEDGITAVRIARAAATAETKGEGYSLPPDLGESFEKESGAFVTICEHPSRDLRACIGYPLPFMSLGEAVAESARNAVHDPRFPVLTTEEADSCVFEVTILTPPEEVEYGDPARIPEMVVIGRDGLMIECDGCRGLFLPQVPVEQGWNVIEYLDHLCFKAGLGRDAWRSGRARLYRFGGEVFEEDAPFGNISRRE